MIDMMKQPIDVLGLSGRVYNCLKRAGVDTVGQLAKMSRRELLEVRNMGHRGIDEISLTMGLFYRGLKFG